MKTCTLCQQPKILATTYVFRNQVLVICEECVSKALCSVIEVCPICGKVSLTPCDLKIDDPIVLPIECMVCDDLR